MKIATFNVNSIRARLPVLLSWVEKNRPDVLCAQETKVQDPDFPRQQFEQLGYRCAFRGQPAYNGVAIFSAVGLEKIRFGLDDEPSDPARLVSAMAGPVRVVNTYVPQGQSVESEVFQYKLCWFRRLKKYLDNHFKPTDPLVVVGDFNVAPQPMDVYDPDRMDGHVCFHPLVRRALEELMDWGLVDVFRRHCEDAGCYSFWDYRQRGSFKRNLGWRLDLILATKPLAAKSIACCIDKEPRTAERPSDHTPVVAEFEI